MRGLLRLLAALPGLKEKPKLRLEQEIAPASRQGWLVPVRAKPAAAPAPVPSGDVRVAEPDADELALFLFAKSGQPKGWTATEEDDDPGIAPLAGSGGWTRD